MPEVNRFTGKVEPSIRDYRLHEALALIDRRFGIDKLMRDLKAPRDTLIERYYQHSRKGYERYSDDAAMHFSLVEGDQYTYEGLQAQGDTVIAKAREMGAKRILELGCGQAYNARHVAAQLPDVEVVGLDLMAHHVEAANARGANLTNFRCVQGSWTDIPADLGEFDIIFAVETLCYAADVEDVVPGVVERLKPGGLFLIHDGFRKPDFDTFSEDMQTAEVLNELCMAVTDGFFTEGDFEASMERNGLVDVTTEDLSPLCLGTCRRLGRLGVLFMVLWRYRILHRFVPRHLARNAVSGILGIYVIFGDSIDYDVDKGIVRYNLVTGRKPG